MSFTENFLPNYNLMDENLPCFFVFVLFVVIQIGLPALIHLLKNYYLTFFPEYCMSILVLSSGR